MAFVTQVLLIYIPFIPLVEAKLNCKYMLKSFLSLLCLCWCGKSRSYNNVWICDFECWMNRNNENNANFRQKVFLWSQVRKSKEMHKWIALNTTNNFDFMRLSCSVHNFIFSFTALCQRWIMLLWITTLLHIVLQIYFHLDILQKEKGLLLIFCHFHFSSRKKKS